MKKFTFKTEKPKGYGRFNFIHQSMHYIKLNGKVCGSIDDKHPHKIRLTVIKKDIMEDGNGNCTWKWITLKQESDTLDLAKEYINLNFELINSIYQIRTEE